MWGITNAGASGGSGGTGKREVYGYYVDMDDPVPETRVHYIEDNENYTPMSCVLTNEGGWNMGSWSTENCFILKGNRPCMVRYDGTIDYFLDPQNYVLRADGSGSDVSNTNYGGNAMATIPLIWVKRYTDGRNQYHLFSNERVGNGWAAYAHMRDDGSIEPYTFYPMFGGSLINGKLRSIAKQQQTHTNTGLQEVSYATANGQAWNVGYYSAIQLIWELEVLFTKSTNGSASCGYGNHKDGASGSNLSETGQLLFGGAFFGAGPNVNTPIKFLHCEQMIGPWERINGWIYNGTHRIKLHGPYNNTAEGYVDTQLSFYGGAGSGVYRTGYESETVLNDLGEIPKTLNGSYETYGCRKFSYRTSSGYYRACVNGLFVSDTGICGGYFQDDPNTARFSISARPYCKAPISAWAEDLLVP